MPHKAIALLSFFLLVAVGIYECLQAAPEPKPDFVGTVEAVAADGKGITVKVPPTKKGSEATSRACVITDQTTVTYETKEKSPRVGQAVAVWLEKGSAERARMVRFRLAE